MKAKLLTMRLYDHARAELDRQAGLAGLRKTNTHQTWTYSWRDDPSYPRLRATAGGDIAHNILRLTISTSKNVDLVAIEVCPAEMTLSKPGRKKARS